MHDTPNSDPKPSTDRFANVRGHAFISVLASLERLRGKSAVQAVLAELSPPLAERLRAGRLAPESWNSIARYRELLAAVVSAAGEGRTLVHAIGFDCAVHDLSGMYRFFARLLRPQSLFSGSMRLFKSYYDTGEVWVVAASSGAAHALWKECHGFDANMWVEVMGSCVAILELGGARHLDMQVVNGGGDADAHLELKATWR